MKVEDIREFAKQYDIKAGKMKKADLVRAIQAAENNEQCFDTGRLQSCDQYNCLWRADCT